MTLLTWQALTLQLVNPFRVSYGSSDTRTAFWIRLSGDEGWGEGTIPFYYNIPNEAMTAFWDETARRSDPLPDDPADIPAWVGQAGPSPARCAVDLALHDRIARQRGLPLYQLLGLPEPKPMISSFTISIAEPEEMARMALDIPHYSIIKIKLGGDDRDEARLAAIRAARPDARLRVDANAGWDAEGAARLVERLEKYNLELIEQPVGKDDFEGMGFVQKHTHLPIAADESVRSLEDIEKLAAVGVKAVNLKLMKVGGLAPAVKMLRRARELGMQVMLGCMIETSIGITAMAHLMGMADWVDLDAPILIANDPFDGARFSPRAEISLPGRPGIGALLKPVR